MRLMLAGAARGGDTWATGLDQMRCGPRAGVWPRLDVWPSWEAQATAVQANAVVTAARHRLFRHIVIDDTHIDEVQVRYLRDVLAGVGVQWRVHDLTGVPVEECLRRNAERDDPLDPGCIWELHHRLVAASAAGWVLSAGWLAGETAGVGV
jgi:hypothetical protein